jgi:hypothetical protein
MAIIGAHMLLYSSEPDALRAMLRDAFGFECVDAGGGWLIFALPPSELGVHPAEGPTHESGVRHQVSFMCDDIRATIAQLRPKGIQIDGEPKDEGWGINVIQRDDDITRWREGHAIRAASRHGHYPNQNKGRLAPLRTHHVIARISVTLDL